MKLFLPALLVLCSQGVLAQNVIGRDSVLHRLEEVSVVGFYRDNVSKENVISRDFLLKKNKGQEPSFILSSRPSVFAYSDTGNEYGYSYFRMRGMDQTRVNMTMDGMPLNEGEDMGVYFSNYPDVLSSIHSVKVTNGANVSGNGVAGYAGSIDFESVNLEQDTTSSAYAGYGSFNTFKSSVEYNSGRRGKFAAHIKLTQQQSDGYRDHAYNNSQSGFMKLGYFINNHHSIDFLSFIGQSRNGQGWIGSSLEEIEISKSHNGCSDKETDLFVQNINKLQYKGYISDKMSITAALYYNYLKGHYFFDVDNFMVKVVDPTWESCGEIDAYRLQHNMFGGNFATRFYMNDFTLTTGMNASSFNRRHIGTTNLSSDELWHNKGYKNDANVFAKGEYLHGNLYALVNVQYRHADFDYKGDVDFSKLNWDFFNWSAKLAWRFDNNHSLYASTTQTHREPTRSDMFGGKENLSEIVTTQAESVIDYELCYNINLRRLSGNLNLFYMDFTNELILNGQMGTNGLPIRENTAKSYRTGAELSIIYEPIDGLKLVNTTSYSINKVETGDETLNHVLSPSWLITQGVNYTIKHVEIGIDMKYRSKMYFDLPNQYQLDGAARFNLYATYDINNITIGANLNNIFNKKCFSNGMLGANGPLYFIDAPRNCFIDVRWKF